MGERKDSITLFQEWVNSKYKRNTAFQLNKALECVNAFLRRTHHSAWSITDLSAENAIQQINALNQNRLFKNTYKDAMPFLSKLSKAVAEFKAENPTDQIQPMVPERSIHDSISHIDPNNRENAVPLLQNNSATNDRIPQSNEPKFVLAYSNSDRNPTPINPEDKIISASVQKSTPVFKGEKLYQNDTCEPADSDFDKHADTEISKRNLPSIDEQPIIHHQIESDVFRALEKCKLSMDGQIISEESLLKSYLQYLSRTSQKDAHNIGFVMHTGSIVFDALSVFWATVSCLTADRSDPEEIIQSLNIGDLVIYNNNKGGHDRYRFDGIETINGIEYSVLRKDDKDNSCSKVPKPMWNKILPYLGDATSLYDQETKHSDIVRKLFFTKVLGVRENAIPSVFETSIVFVMPRERADRIVKGLSISFFGNTLDLLDLVTASYYTDNGEMRYRGNLGRNEPVLKFTAKLSIGRKIMLQKRGNTHYGLFICDDEIIRKSQTEIPELLDRKSIPFIFTTACIDSESTFELLEAREEATAFACTKDFLLSNLLTIQEENDYTKEIYTRIDSIVDHEVKYDLVDGFIDWNTFKEFKKCMFSIRNSDYKTNELDDFIIHAWTLFNLFQTMPFSIEKLEKEIIDGNIPTALPADRIKKLKELEYLFPDFIRVKTAAVIALLEMCYAELKDETLSYRHKSYAFEKIVSENAGKNICIIVPKAYYEKVLNQSSAIQLAKSTGQVTIVTANRFDNNSLYDLIICTGDYKGSRFDGFRCMSAPCIISLIYGFEKNTWISRKRKASSAVRLINKRSYTSVVEEDDSELIYDENEKEDEIAEIIEQTDATESYIRRLQTKLPELQSYSRYSDSAIKETDIAAIVTFESGEKAFLTPFYEACVFNEEEESIKEIHINEIDLNEGDYIVFTRNDSMMHDIVDDILTLLIQDGKLPEEEMDDYKRSKAWKNKLREYKKISHKKSRDIAERMRKEGISITEQTIRIWTDPEAHTVGPRKLEVISAIGKIVFDDEMMNHPEITMNSCRRIRQRRRKILDIIGNTIIEMLSGRKAKSNDPSEREIQERISTQADILRIESFIRVSKKVPIAFVNRPVSL